MKILLINPAVQNYYKSITGPLGVLAVASYLQQHGHTVKFVDRCVRADSIAESIDSFAPQVIGVAFMSEKVIDDVQLIYSEASKRGIPVVAGGATATMVPEMLLREGCADIIIKGEGELTWDELARLLESGDDYKSIRGICYLENGKFISNEDREFADLADFPPIDWTLAGDPSVYFQTLFGIKNVIYIYSAKGCPGECTFCYNKGFSKRCYRKRPLETALEEIAVLTPHGLDGVHFSDEIWCKNSSELHENCKTITDSGLSFKWGCNFRIGQVKPEDFRLMYEAGCRWIFFGVESGSDYIQQKMKKKIRLDKVYETVKACCDAGINAITSFIVGFPGEREQDLRATVQLIQSIPFSMFDCNFFFPFIGTEAHDVLVSEGRYKSPQNLDDLRRTGISEYRLVKSINFSEVPTRDLKVVRSWILWRSFTRNVRDDSGKKHPFAMKAIIDAIKSLFGGGFAHFFVSFYISASMFLNVVFNVFCFPGVRKKYGITLRAKKDK